MFALTPAAARQIQQAASDAGAQDQALRVAARQTQDGSLEYGMGFDEPQDEDLQLDLLGVTVLIGQEYQALLQHTELDYVELEPGEFHFIFAQKDPAPASGSLPDSAKSSGCGGCGGGNCGGAPGREH